MSSDNSPIDFKQQLRHRFDRQADQYDEVAVVQKEVSQRLLERLDYIRIDPEVVLDAGCGTGFAIPGLLEAFPSSRLLAMDVAPAMLAHAKRRGGWFKKPLMVCGDAEQIPLADDSVDLVFSSLMLQWCDAETAINEFWRVLKPGGLLLFTTFGPDTLKELRASWQQVDKADHVNQFTDMHDIGDQLLRSGLSDPVMDMEILTLTYTDAPSVIRDLKMMGANTLRPGPSVHGLTTPSRLRHLGEAYEQFRQDGVLPATFEIVYGHGWKLVSEKPSRHTGEVHVPVDVLKKGL